MFSRHLAAGLAIGFVILGTLTAWGDQTADQTRPRPAEPAVKKDGWWIRISPDPKVQTITWRFSDPAKTGAAPETVTWTRAGGSDNFDLPESLRLRSPLAFDVAGSPTGGTASFCLFYAANGVKLVELPGAAKGTVEAKMRDKGCAP